VGEKRKGVLPLGITERPELAGGALNCERERRFPQKEIKEVGALEG